MTEGALNSQSLHQIFYYCSWTRLCWQLWKGVAGRGDVWLFILDAFITKMICNNETAGAVTWFILMYACKWVRNGINIISVLWFSLRSWDYWFIYSLQYAQPGSYVPAQMVGKARPCAMDQWVNVNITVYGYSSSKGPEPGEEGRWQQRLLSSSRVLNPSLWSLCSSFACQDFREEGDEETQGDPRIRVAKAERCGKQ